MLDVGIIEDNGWRLSTELESDSLDIVSSCLHDKLADCGGTSESYLLDFWVVDDGRTDGLTVANDNVDGTSWEACLLNERAETKCREWCDLRWFQNHRTASSEGRSEFPGLIVATLAYSTAATCRKTHCHQNREVPRDNLTNDVKIFKSRVRKLVVADINRSAVYLVCPSTEVSEVGSSLWYIETSCELVWFAVVE